jgi:cell division protein FtsL
MRPFAFFDRRIRGFRVVEVGAASFLLILVLLVYLAKTGAGDKRDDIDRAQQQIDADQGQIRLLRAEVATLEQPERLEALSAQYLNLQPIPAQHEVTAEALADIARQASGAAQAAPATALAQAPTAGQTPAAQPASDDQTAAATTTTPAPAAHKIVLAMATTSISAAKPAHIAGPSTPKAVHKKPASIDSMLDDADTANSAPAQELH